MFRATESRLSAGGEGRPNAGDWSLEDQWKNNKITLYKQGERNRKISSLTRRIESNERNRKAAWNITKILKKERVYFLGCWRQNSDWRRILWSFLSFFNSSVSGGEHQIYILQENKILQTGQRGCNRGGKSMLLPSACFLHAWASAFRVLPRTRGLCLF